MRLRWLFITLSIILSTAMHWRVFSLDLQSNHVWRQTQTQTQINNFYAEDFCILNPRINSRGVTDGIYRMEFPLHQWSTAALYRIFGPGVRLSRIFNFLISILTALGIYYLSKSIFQNKKQQIGLIAFHCLLFAPSFYYYSLCPMPDNLALCFGTWGLYASVAWMKKGTPLPLFLASILLALAALVKLPFILYYCFPGIYIISKVKKKPNPSIKAALIFLLFIMPVFVWYIAVIPAWQGNGIVHGILSEHTNWRDNLYWLFGNISSTLPELILGYASVPLFLIGSYAYFKDKQIITPHLRLPFLALLIVCCMYVVFEINMITTIHDYYLFPLYPLAILTVAAGAAYLLQRGSTTSLALLMICLIALPITTHLRMKIRWRPDRLGFPPALLHQQKELQAIGQKDDLWVVGNDISRHIFLYYINRKGWTYHENQLSAADLNSMIANGATYLLSDSRATDTKPELQPMLDSLILEAGTLRVFVLRKR